LHKHVGHLPRSKESAVPPNAHPQYQDFGWTKTLFERTVAYSCGGSPMTDRVVFIPCRLDRRDALRALVEDADGGPRRVVGPMGRVEGRLVVVAKWLREAGGRHEVSFEDGMKLWVVQEPKVIEDFVRLV